MVLPALSFSVTAGWTKSSQGGSACPRSKTTTQPRHCRQLHAVPSSEGNINTNAVGPKMARTCLPWTPFPMTPFLSLKASAGLIAVGSGGEGWGYQSFTMRVHRVYKPLGTCLWISLPSLAGLVHTGKGSRDVKLGGWNPMSTYCE